MCFILIGVICVGLSGCVEGIIKAGWKAATDVSKSEQKAMLKHLEKKYNEKFVKEIHLPNDESSLSRGATVYPEGRENEEFYVNLGTKGSKKVVDDYVLREPEKRMTSLYEQWIQRVTPSAKVAVKLSIGSRSGELFYNPDKTLQQFVSQTDEMSIDVSIMLSETMLENKDDIFEKLSMLLQTEPISVFKSNRYIVTFFVQKAFNNITSGEHRYMSLYLPDKDDAEKDLVAITFCYTKNLANDNNTQSNIIKQLNERFEIKEES